ncbi:hypothetical protein P8C59_008329 [Phyllachora maydis]|uniref:Uncharacterized protein n=1 Tax=Phyllachora maydis TaxID=1825666 RepID=A0AAD9IC16_9PEZI|nr:hypothetical protein P8C59_008329 [Phyllachora maydis]
MLRSRKAFYDALPIFLTAFPIGTLWLIFACWPGNEMPLQSIYATAFFAIFGNITSANALVYLIAADSTHESRRTQSFFYLYSIYLVCELLAPMIALVAMENHPKSRLRNRRPPSCVSPGL